MGKSKVKERIGETRMMNCGLNATIIAYRGANNIDIKFKDNTIVTNKTYSNFLIGEIKHPKISPAKYWKDSRKFREDRKTETKMMNCGQYATIIAYRGSKDIDVRFEDGTIVEHKHYEKFKKGAIQNPQIKRVKRLKINHLNETRTMSNGMSATIIAYRNYKDIDIKFEDGIIVTHKRYEHYKKGYIQYP